MIEIELLEEVGELNVGVLASSFSVRKSIPDWHGSLLTLSVRPTLCSIGYICGTLRVSSP